MIWENAYQLLTKKNRYTFGERLAFPHVEQTQQGGDMVPKDETANAQTQWVYR